MNFSSFGLRGTRATSRLLKFNQISHQLIENEQKVICDHQLIRNKHTITNHYSLSNRLFKSVHCLKTRSISSNNSKDISTSSHYSTDRYIKINDEIESKNIKKMAKSKYEYIRDNEEYSDRSLLSDCYIVIRVDGSRFHLFSSVHDYVKPNDKRALDLMNDAAMHVVRLYFPNIICAYGQSDEYSFVLSKKSGLFNRRLNKLNSMICSAFTSSFVFNWSKYFGFPIDEQNNNTNNRSNSQSNKIKINNQSNVFKDFVKLQYPPVFDGRCVLYTSENEIKDYLRWRQVDCHINNLYNTTFNALMGKYARWYEQDNVWKAEIVELLESSSLTPQEAENRLKGTVSKQKREDILKGMFNIEYENEMEQFRRGSFIVMEKKNERMFDEYHQFLMLKKKRKTDQYNLDDFINFQILHQELIQSDYLDNYINKMISFVK